MAIVAGHESTASRFSHLERPLAEIFTEMSMIQWGDSGEASRSKHIFTIILKTFREGLKILEAPTSPEHLRASVIAIAKIRGSLEEHYFLKDRTCFSPNIDHSIQLLLGNLTCVTALYAQYSELLFDIEEHPNRDLATNQWTHYKISELHTQVSLLRTATDTWNQRTSNGYYKIIINKPK